MDFDAIINRKNTYCTQWDYVGDRFGVSDLLPFTISDTDFALPVEVQTALSKRLARPIFGYTRWNHFDFKQSVVGWYQKRFQTDIQQEWIQFSPSVIYAISRIIEMKSQIHEGVVLFSPAYDAFFGAIRENQREVVESYLIYRNFSYQIDFQDLEEKLSRKENTIFLLCSPHNPTGRVWTESELEKIVLLCEKYQVFLIADEIHMDILREGKRHYPISRFAKEGNYVLATSGSKTFNFPSLNFAYLLIPDELLRNEFEKRLKFRDGLSSCSALGLEATMAAYQGSEAWVDALNDYIDGNFNLVSDFVRRYLPRIKLVHSEATYLAWLDLAELGKSGEEVQKELIERGKVAIMSGKVYGEVYENFLRMNIGCPRSKVLQGLKSIEKALQAKSEK
ncbi:MAG: pyridoxal phosphate-dependent aminotransferase [Streptococcaceae bacterium]|nr:pyridoxal phosphate-dependent aminotransferase [Streptococcaceae bacterium]